MLRTFEKGLLKGLIRFNDLIHAALALALVVASLMVLWEFGHAVMDALHRQNIAVGFLQALGTLFILWTLSSLISAEIEFVKTGVFQVTVFIEVAIITLLRQLIVEPVQMAASDGAGLSDRFVIQHLLILGALLVVGVLHKLVSSGQKAKVATSRTSPD